MAVVEELAAFVVRAGWEDLSESAREQLRLRILDAVACALGALDAEPVRRVREHVEAFGGRALCTLAGGGRSAPDRAALYNGFLVRYLDFNDSYLARGETCHPSDNLGAVLAASEHEGGGGRDLMTALAVAYQVQCRLSDEAPVRARGFDHTVQGQYAAAAGVAHALGLDAEHTAHAVAISATAHNALRVTRTGSLSHWKGLAAPETGFTAVHAAFLAARGVTGPREVFEGNKGFQETIAGEFRVDWEGEDLERVRRTLWKKHNAEIHSQATLDAVLALREAHGLDGSAVDAVEVDTFGVAYHIIGGGEEGEKTTVRTKEEADHSLPYLVAVALLDGEVLPDQYRPERIAARDVQALLRKVRVRERDAFSERFPEAMPCDVRITVDGRTVEAHRDDYEGFPTRPASWEAVEAKLHALGAGVDAGLRRELAAAIRDLDTTPVRDLCGLLARAHSDGRPGRTEEERSS